MKNYLAIIALALITFTSTTGNVMAAEEIKYDVVNKEGDIEIRQYKPVVVAEVTVTGSEDEAANKAFRTLFDYISGENSAEQSIPMTAPVSQEASQEAAATENSQKIPMTAPVSQTKAEEGKWTVAFYMPAEMTMETAPKPNNENITMREENFGKMAAIRFTGARHGSNLGEAQAELEAYLTQNDIAFENDPIYAYYNGPFTLWFLRRNEVLFPLK